MKTVWPLAALGGAAGGAAPPRGPLPQKIAQALAYGLIAGDLPIIGSTTLLALLVGIPLRLNQPVLQAFKTLARLCSGHWCLVFTALARRCMACRMCRFLIPRNA